VLPCEVLRPLVVHVDPRAPVVVRLGSVGIDGDVAGGKAPLDRLISAAVRTVRAGGEGLERARQIAVGEGVGRGAGEHHAASPTEAKRIAPRMIIRSAPRSRRRT